MVRKNKWLLLQVLFLAILIFIIGFYSGIKVEETKLTEINDYYVQSEVSLVDTLAFNSLVKAGKISCSELEKSSVELLDKIYEEAQLYQEYVNLGMVTEDLETFHTKYDVLRTYFWINTIEIKKNCDSHFSTIVYLYNSKEKDLTIRAKQNTLSNILSEIKNELGDEVFLIPIAYDSNLVSLESLTAQYNLESFPAIIVNEKDVFYESVSKSDLLSVL